MISYYYVRLIDTNQCSKVKWKRRARDEQTIDLRSADIPYVKDSSKHPVKSQTTPIDRKKIAKIEEIPETNVAISMVEAVSQPRQSQ